MSEESAELRVLIVDDDDAVRSSIRYLLQISGVRCRSANSVREALAQLGDDQETVVLTDVQMPDADGLTLLGRLRAAGHANPIIIMTAYGNVSLAVQAMQQGADDFIQKPLQGDELFQALDRVKSRVGLRRAASDRTEAVRRFEKLSPRESDVLQALIDGGTSRSIAERLGLSPRTVEEYRRSIHTKTATGSIPDLFRLALEAGWSASPARRGPPPA